MAIAFKNVRAKLGLDDTLPFEKYRGYTVLEVLKYRPTYISWLMQNTDTKFYQSVHDELLRQILRHDKPRGAGKYRNSTRMPDYDHDTLGEWFDDVPF